MRRTKKTAAPVVTILTDTTECKRYYFSNPLDFINEIEFNHSNYEGAKIQIERLINSTAEKSSYGAESFTQAREIMNSFVSEHTRELVNAGMNHSLVSELVPSVAGQFNDVSAFIEGNPECMADFETVQANQFRTIKINLSIAWDEPLARIQQRSNEVLRAVYALESSGTRCKVIAAFSLNDYERGTGIHDVNVMVKDFQEPINPALHGFCLGNAVFFRCYMLAFGSMVSKQHSIGRPMIDEAAVVNYQRDQAGTIYDKIINQF